MGEHTHTHTREWISASVRVFQPLSDGLYLAYPRCVSGRGRHRCPQTALAHQVYRRPFWQDRATSFQTASARTDSAKKEKLHAQKKREKKKKTRLSCQNQQLDCYTWNTIAPFPPARWPPRREIIWHDKKKMVKTRRKIEKDFSTISSWWMADGWDLHPSDSYNQQQKKWRNPRRTWIATIDSMPAAGFPSDPFYGTSVIDFEFVCFWEFFFVDCRRGANGNCGYKNVSTFWSISTNSSDTKCPKKEKKKNKKVVVPDTSGIE